MRQDKNLLLDEVLRYQRQFGDFVVVRYSGLTANMSNRLRVEVFERGGELHLLRKTLLLKVAESMGIDLRSVCLEGHIGLLFTGKDSAEMIKAVSSFSQSNNNVIALVGGYVERQVYGGEEILEIGLLPSKPEMQAQLLATFEAPLAGLLAVIDSLLCAVPHCLENKCSQNECQPNSGEAA